MFKYNMYPQFETEQADRKVVSKEMNNSLSTNNNITDVYTFKHMLYNSIDKLKEQERNLKLMQKYALKKGVTVY